MSDMYFSCNGRRFSCVLLIKEYKSTYIIENAREVPRRTQEKYYYERQ